MTESDAVLNDETRRALRWRGRQIGMVVIGAAVALPLAVPYAMLRVLGLSHRDVLYVGKQAYRETVVEVIALSGTQQTADVFTESNALDAEAENSSPEAEEMDAAEASEHESTDLQQQTEPEPQP